jgi:AI-2 transport protein TqsA
MKISNFTESLILFFGVVLALVFGKELLLPFLIALLIYFLIRSFRRFFDRIKFIKNHVPAWLKNSIAALIVFLIIGLLVDLLIINGQNLGNSLTNYVPKIDKILVQLHELIGKTLTEKLSETLKSINISSLVRPIIDSLTGIMGNFAMVPFYLLFLFIEEIAFKNKLLLLFSKPEELKETKQLLRNIENSITHYIGLKTLVSLITATTCFAVFLFFGLDSPVLWAFLVFILNFIPIIGSFVGVLLPSLFAMIQFGEINAPLILLLLLTGIQMLIGNILEPKIMGGSLNISPLVALISLSFWGAIWGIVGMLVSVPITVILIILLAHFPRTKNIAILLSNNGKV